MREFTPSLGGKGTVLGSNLWRGKPDKPAIADSLACEYLREADSQRSRRPFSAARTLGGREQER
jgi:hypothetical protein